jgi:hypothetical protein
MRDMSIPALGRAFEDIGRERAKRFNGVHIV